MGFKKSKKSAKGRLDKYYHMAKEQGFRARSAFKLIQLNKKHKFLDTAKCVVDLCAAPGGWLQVCSKYMPQTRTLVGVDLVAIRPIPNCQTIVGDITTPQVRNELKKILGKYQADAVLHDGAPNVGTAWVQDAYTQSVLVLASLKLAVELLRPGGTFVTKVFRSADYNKLLWVFQHLFKKVEATKPQSSRNTSAEIFVVCEGYLDPKKIDPKMLDAKHVFKDVEEDDKPVDLFAKKSRKPAALGYEEGNVTLFKKCSVRQFIESDDPVTMLAQYNQFQFEKEDRDFKQHKATDQEILYLCDDLKILSKGDFKRLLKWREAILKSMKPKREEVVEEEPAKKTEEEEEEEINEALDEAIRSMSKREKKAKKKINEKKAKIQKRIDMKMILPGDTIAEEDQNLFQLQSVNDDLVNDIIDQEAPDTMLEDEPPSEEDVKSGEEDEDYDEVLDDMLEEMYAEYVSHTLSRKERISVLKKRKEKEEKEQLKQDTVIDEHEQKRRKIVEGFVPKVSGDVFSDEEEERKNSLLVKEDEEEIPASKKADIWFSQFKGLIDEDENQGEAIANMKKSLGLKVLEEGTQLLGPFFKDNILQAFSDSEGESDEEGEGVEEDMDNRPESEGEGEFEDSEEDIKSESDDDIVPRSRGTKMAKNGPSQRGEGDFEEVPVEEFKDDSSSDEEMDQDQKLYGLALGTMMVRDRKRRRDMIDDTYNRYAFNDTGLPSWFEDDEIKFNKPIPQVTKEIMEEIKRKAMELNARPIKKVAEAKGRKKIRAARKFAKLKQTAETIANSTEITPGEKTRQIEKLYKKLAASDKAARAKTIVVNNKSGGTRIGNKKGGRVKLVDSRLKKDMRNTNIKMKNTKKGKRKGGKHSGKNRDKKGAKKGTTKE